jgi:ribose transport system permease protein
VNTTTGTVPANVAAPPRADPAHRAVLERVLPFAGALAVLFELVFFAVQAPTFFSIGNILNVLVQGSVVAVTAFGLAVVVIVGGEDVVKGGIDLSVGAVMGLVGSLVALRVSEGTPVVGALGWGFGAAVLVGLLNAGSVALGVRPLLATLAAMGIAQSTDLIVSNNQQIPISDPLFVWIRDGSVLGLPVPVAVLFALFVVVWAVMDFMHIGVRAYAVGGNPLAARVAGLSVGRYVAVSYVFSAVCAALAGLLLTARLSGNSPGVGALLLLDIILAAFMSMIFSRRLVVNIPGTLAGALFVAALNNGFTLVNVPTYWVSGVKGLLILLVLGVAALRARRTTR